MSSERYRQAGVDIDAGARLVERIAPLARSTRRPEVLGTLGGFGSAWSIPAGRYRDLVLVSGTDGVGTKVKVAQRAGRHDTVGIDLVAMCVNDVVCVGAEPFFFLDYYASGALDVDAAAQVVSGIAEGCRRAGCALVGGETAEMPGVYAAGVYDLAGFVVGGTERDAILDPSKVRLGMAAIGLASSGLHSNGYSLARRIVFEEQGLGLDDELPGCGRSVADELLEPTRIYVKPVLDVLSRFEVGGVCHVTGGGLIENLPRVLPAEATVEIRRDAWQLPPVFRFLQRAAELDDRELLTTFNAGVGMVLLVAEEQADEIVQALEAHGEVAFRLGSVRRRAQGAAAVSLR